MWTRRGRGGWGELEIRFDIHYMYKIVMIISSGFLKGFVFFFCNNFLNEQKSFPIFVRLSFSVVNPFLKLTRGFSFPDRLLAETILFPCKTLYQILNFQALIFYFFQSPGARELQGSCSLHGAHFGPSLLHPHHSSSASM